MQHLPERIAASFARRLDQAQVPASLRADYYKWIRLYLYFCEKFGYPATAPTVLGPFLTRLATKSYSIEQRRHATIAVKLLLRPDPQELDLYIQLSAPSRQTPQPTGLKPFSTAAGLSTGSASSASSHTPKVNQPDHTARAASWEKEFRDLEGAISLRNYSTRTLEAYRFWVSRFHTDIKTTMIYLQTVPTLTLKDVKSPLDLAAEASS